MYRFLLPLLVAAAAMPAAAQTNPPPSAGFLPAFADVVETAGPLTLPEALHMALDTNPALSATRYEVEAAEAAITQADALPNPSLDMSVEDRRRETRETTFLLNQPIELGGKRRARVAAAEYGKHAAAVDLEAKRADVRAAVITNFFEVLAAQQRLRLAQDAASLAQRATTVAARRVIAGKVSPVEETKARVAESSVRLELGQARLELAAARRELAALWGNTAPRFEHADGRLNVLPALPEAEDLSRRIAQAPATRRARFELDRRQALARLEDSRRVPDLTLSLGVRRSEELGRNQAIVGVSIPLPLFDSNRGNVLEAAHWADQAREELRATEIRMHAEIEQALARLSLARQEAATLQDEIVPGAQSAYDAAAKGFEYGKFGFLDVLDAQRTLLQAQSQTLRALSEAHRAAAEIDRILGEPLHAAKQ